MNAKRSERASIRARERALARAGAGMSFFIRVRLLNLQGNCIWKLKSCPDSVVEGSAKVANCSKLISQFMTFAEPSVVIESARI